MALVQALLEAGAEFPKIPDRDTAKQTQPATSWPSELCNTFVLDQPCYNMDIVQVFLARHDMQKCLAPFAETPLGLIVMEPDGPTRRMRMVNYSHPDTISSLLSLLRQYQPLDDPLLFWAAVMNNHEDIVRYLVKDGVDIELRHKGMTPLHTAVLHGRVDIFNFLLENGADVRATTSQRRLSTLHMLFWTIKPRETESLMFDIILRRLGGDFIPFCRTQPSGPVVSPLHLAVMSRRIDAVRDLLRCGADPLSVIFKDIRSPPLEASFSTWRQQFARVNRWGIGPSSRPSKFDKPQPTIPLTGYTATGIVVMWEDIFSPKEAESLLVMLLQLNDPVPPSEAALFSCNPERNITILHLLAISPLWSLSRLRKRIIDCAKGADCFDSKMADADGDTPLHYACVTFGGHSEEQIPLDMFTDGAASNENCKQKNNHGLTPPEARFWSFADENCKRASDFNLSINLLTSDDQESYDAKKSARNSAIGLGMVSKQAEQAWWELERAADVLWKWDSKTRTMLQSTYSDIASVKFSPVEPGFGFLQYVSAELSVHTDPSRRALD